MRLTATLMAAAVFAAPVFADKEAKGPVYEPNTYRFGGTYSVVSSQSPSQCATACGRDSNCMAWSYVDLPGASIQNACELKSTLGKSEENPSSTSGISHQIERNFQPSQYNTRTLANGRSFSAPTSRRLYGGTSPVSTTPPKPLRATQKFAAPAAPATITSRAPALRSAPAAPATISTHSARKMAAPAAPATITSKTAVYKALPAAPATITSAKPVRMAAPAAPATVTSSTPAKMAAPAAPATIRSTTPAKMRAPAAPATVFSSAPAKRAAPAAPAVVTASSKPITKSVLAAPKAPAAVKVASKPAPKTQPITIKTAPKTPIVKSVPTVKFSPLKPKSDGTFVQSKPAVAKKEPQGKTTRVVLTGPTGKDVGKAVHGRVVLKGDMAGESTGGVGATPAAPIPRNVPVNAQGERVPYKDISSRDYPDYSVTRAAEQGAVDPVGTEEIGSSLPGTGG